MSVCTDTCARPTTSQAHCPTCHETFAGVVFFDEHRKNGECLDPRVVRNGGLTQDERGVWRWIREIRRPAFSQYHPSTGVQTAPEPSESPGGTRA